MAEMGRHAGIVKILPGQTLEMQDGEKAGERDKAEPGPALSVRQKLRQRRSFVMPV
jgi:hypothetical protein